MQPGYEQCLALNKPHLSTTNNTRGRRSKHRPLALTAELFNFLCLVNQNAAAQAAKKNILKGTFQCLSTQGKGEGFMQRRVALGFGKIRT